MIERASLITIFFLSILFVPWWFSVVLAIMIASRGEDFFVLPIGGVLLDVLFGVPVVALGGFSFIYTVVFSAMAIGGYILKDSIV
ncbi:hypothetical protein COU15_01080 [Candidatus Kaiserbacteria bacterium CG10_big_fil_rev_8_21_14_0_10_45_20]|uniref:Rod shape-determining protein MreD n=1 Tax=Candidatus Kaiserbacteria bacterium CG10_big_fil_rev_8_21_14_0_10_45_20 TaxID=1974607 RepID=A0A2H0UHY3_9BACT|nr:MAG: hypothetical protein COU15_01080 [Candidatus Kaiserbacteria bacterium CG10_big_fil_rev_8_21_14_0_10_45_20]